MWPNCSQSLPSPSWNVRSSMVKVTWNMSMLFCCLPYRYPPQKKIPHLTELPLWWQSVMLQDTKINYWNTSKRNLILCTNEYAELRYICCTAHVWWESMWATMPSSPATWIPCETDCLSSHASHKSQRAPNLHSPQESREPRVRKAVQTQLNWFLLWRHLLLSIFELLKWDKVNNKNNDYPSHRF